MAVACTDFVPVLVSRHLHMFDASGQLNGTAAARQGTMLQHFGMSFCCYLDVYAYHWHVLHTIGMYCDYPVMLGTNLKVEG